ncbi:MAG TPA: hypothetical protein VHN98_10740 [Acidimicrobiales bacterium]|nr:hypothetical protein [Acidimicrobiales bacterium]
MVRKLAVALVLCALVASAAAVAGGPVGAQTPPVAITSISPTCGGLNVTVTVTVNGNAPVGGSGTINVTNPQTASIGSSNYTTRTGSWSATVTFTPTLNGYYRVIATDSATGAADYRLFSAPCRNPHVTFDPPCSTPGTTQTLTVTGLDFAPSGVRYSAFGYVYYDWNGDGGADFRQPNGIPIDTSGNFATSPSYKSTPFTVTPPADRDVPIHVYDDTANTVDAVWLRCPPPTTTTTTTAPVITTTTTSTTVTPGTPTTTTTSTTIPIPPPTPGVSLTVTPAIGPAGFVALAQGSGFPPGAVTLVWNPGIGTTPATAGPDGTFTVQVLIFGHDILGPRALIASGGGVSAAAPFLVVPSTMQPSGKDVTQITRIRRFLGRSG